VVVATVTSADTLSTVALSLAVLAFVVQIIVFIVQMTAAERQSSNSRELHEHLMSLVAQLDERSEHTQKSMDQMNSRMLEAIIQKGIPGVVQDIASNAETAPTPLPSSRGRSVASATRTLDAVDEMRFPEPLGGNEAAAIHAEMQVPVSEAEAVGTWELLQDYSTDDLYDLYRLAEDQLAFTAPHVSFGPGLRMLPQDRVITDGLAEKIPGWRLYTLSSVGRKAGRVFTAGLANATAAPELQKMIDAMHEERARRLEQSRNREGPQDLALN